MNSHHKTDSVIGHGSSSDPPPTTTTKRKAQQNNPGVWLLKACLAKLWRTRHPAGYAGIHRTWGDVFTGTSNQGHCLKKKNQEAAHGRHQAFVLTCVDARELTKCSLLRWRRWHFIPATKPQHFQKWSHFGQQQRARQLHCRWLQQSSEHKNCSPGAKRQTLHNNWLLVCINS